MPVRLTNEEIARLIEESKPLPEDWHERLRPQAVPDGQQATASMEVVGSEGHRFVVKTRQNLAEPLDFCAILACRIPGDDQLFTLRRYNGKGHVHGNPIEGDEIRNEFHVHQATERYQQRGGKEDKYAEQTGRHDDLRSAIGCLLNDCGFGVPDCQSFTIDEGLLEGDL